MPYCPVCGLPTKSRPLTQDYFEELKEFKSDWPGYYKLVMANIGILLKKEDWRIPIRDYNERTHWLNKTMIRNGYILHKYCNQMLGEMPVRVYYSSNDEFKHYRGELEDKFHWEELWASQKIDLVYFPLLHRKSKKRIKENL